MSQLMTSCPAATPACTTALTTFATIAETTTEPTGNGVLENGRAGKPGANLVRIMPTSTNANNQTYNLRVWAWNQVVYPNGTLTWKPTLLAQFGCVAGNLAGLGSAYGVGFHADTITLTYPASSIPSIEIMSPANDLPAHIVLDLKACQKYQIDMDANSSATNCNALVLPY